MDAVEFLRGRLGAMISSGFAADGVRDALGLEGASEVWGGPDTDGNPAWYFWLNSMQGAYRLCLMHAERLDDDAVHAVTGVLSLKYYPSPLEPVYRHFSRQERALIAGDWFDATRTPHMDAQDRVPDTLFNVGAIEFILDVASGQSFLQYSSLDRLRFNVRSGLAGVPVTADARQSVRQVPAWDLGYPLFDAIVGLEAFFARSAPTRIILSRQTGFEFVEQEAGSQQPRDTDAATFKSLLVAFHAADGRGTSPLEDCVTASIRVHPWSPVLDTVVHRVCRDEDHHGHDSGAPPPPRAGTLPTASACRCSNHPAHGRLPFLRTVEAGTVAWRVPLAFNEQWWILGHADVTANVMPCGCH